MNKILIKLYVPSIERSYDILLPLNKKMYNVVILLLRALRELTDGFYNPENVPHLYNKVTGLNYNLEDRVQDTDIKNGTELILI